MLFTLALIMALIYVDFDRTKHNFGMRTNGLGALPSVLAGTAMLPMQHRVLVPWLTWLFSGRWRRVNYDFHKYLDAYILLRWLSITLAVCMAQMWFQVIVPQYSFYATALLVVFFMVAAIYDYTDGYIEVALFAASLLLFQQDFGIVGLGLLGIGVLAGLNRETSVFIPLLGIGTAPANSIFFSAIGVAIGLAIPRVVYGFPKRVDEFFVWRRNLADTRSFFNVPILYNELFFFICTVILAVAAMVMSPSIMLGVFVLMLGALCLPVKWREIRVFAPCMLGIIPGLLR